MKLRGLAALSLVSTAGFAHGQAAVHGLIQSTVEALQSAGKIPRPPQDIPTQPSGFPGLPPKYGAIPAPAPVSEQEGQLRIIRAGSLERSGNHFSASGGVELQYQGYDIFADQIEGDLQTRIFDAYGNVSLIGRDASVVGKHVQFDFRTRTFKADDAEAQIKPGFTKSPLLDDLYVKGRHSYGSAAEVFGEDGWFTTCNLDDPHFQIKAEKTDVRPGKRVIFHNVELDVLGHRIFRLPYLSVPLNEPTYRYIPEVGRTEEEGFYIKTRYPIQLKGDNSFDSRIDYYEKLGTGLGGDLHYDEKTMSGLLTVYALSGQQQTFELNSNHQQQFSFGRLTLDNSFQRHNTFAAPDSTLLSTRASLVIPQGRNESRLSLYQTKNDSSGFNSSQRTLGLDDRRTFGALRTSLNLNWATSTSSFSGGSAVKRDQLDVRFSGQQDLKQATAQLDYQRSIPIGDTSNFFSASDRTPVFTLQSDARRLLGHSAKYTLPFTTSLSTGEYVDSLSRDHITRSSFDLNFNRSDNSRNRTTFSYNGRFRQGLYSDDTAQYILGLGTQFAYRLGRDTSFNLRYNYLRDYGFSPLALDRTGKTNVISGDLSFRPARTLLVGAQTGYDILQLDQGTSPTAWQSVGLRTEWQPKDWFNLRTLSTYDTFQQAWSNIRVDLAYKPGATFVSLGARYDGFRKVWGNVNLFVDNLKWGRLKMSTILQYNGFLKQFEARHFSFTYDLHCAEAILQIIDNPIGFRSGTQIVFFLRLKALPFLSPFGIGQRGQPLGTGTGFGY